MVFKRNLNELIAKNIAETGVDPRIIGPPEHIAKQEVKDVNTDAEFKANEKIQVVKEIPSHLYNTLSIFAKYYNICLSELNRL